MTTGNSIERKPPKLFLSHSHQDRPFVDRLAHELQKNGIDVWLDKWEIQPGDSLVQKIFDEGLSDCELFAVVLSKTSTQSRWVREELDHATVSRIEKKCHVVPVLKEDCEIPPPLRTLLWLDMRADFDQGVRKLVNLAFGVTEKPLVGSPPAHVLQTVDSVGGLSKLATRVGLWLASAPDDETDFEKWYSGEQMVEALGLTPDEVNDAVDELESAGIVRTLKHMGTDPFDFGQIQPTYVLFLRFKEHLPERYDPEADAKAVAAATAARKQLEAAELHAITSIPIPRLNRAVEYLEDYGRIQVLRHMGTAPYDFGTVLATRQTRQLADTFR